MEIIAAQCLESEAPESPSDLHALTVELRMIVENEVQVFRLCSLNLAQKGRERRGPIRGEVDMSFGSTMSRGLRG